MVIRSWPRPQLVSSRPRKDTGQGGALQECDSQSVSLSAHQEDPGFFHTMLQEAVAHNNEDAL